MGFKVVRVVPNVGRIMRSGNTLFCAWNKHSMRDKFPRMTWDYTHWSDVDLLTREMLYASKGKYFALQTGIFREACAPVPSVDFRH